MDRVRFGRALGQGTREAAKALLKAADAVASPNPGAAPASTPRSAAKPREQIVRGAVQQTKPSRAGLKRGGKQFGEAVWKPFARLSGVLWLEFTGVFFALFAFTAGIEVWRRRWDLRLGTHAPRAGWFAVAMLLVFGYFAVSSFVKAGQRGRRR